MFDPRASTPLVGRQQELSALLVHLRTARQGDGGVVLVSGEPGIGKTRLLAEFARHAQAEGWLVLSGRAYETEGMPPYLTFIEALRDYVRTCPLEFLRTQPGDDVAALVLLLPGLRQRLVGEAFCEGPGTRGDRGQRTGDRGRGTGNEGQGPGDEGQGPGDEGGQAGPPLPETRVGADLRVRPGPFQSSSGPQSAFERYRLFESVCDFLLGIAGVGPTPAPGLLLVLEDLHWADRPSLLLLLHLARRLGRSPLLVVGAYRDVGLGRTHPLQEVLADLGHEQLGDELTLDALPSAAIADLIRGVTGAAPAPAVLEALYRETEGNPFFLTEMLKHLKAEGRDLADPGAAPATWDIPEGLRRVIERRLARLSEDAIRMLQAAAILGDGFDFDLLRATSGQEFDPVADALDEALAAGILYQGARQQGRAYHFGHALIRRTLYEAVSPPRRERLHLRAANAIEHVYAENLAPHLAALAAHCRLAGASADRRTALDYARRAADAAATVFA